MKVRMSGGTVLVLLGVAAVLVIAALKWLGSNAALITAGVWTAGKVLFACAVLYLAGRAALAWRARQAAPAAPAAAPAPVRVASERVPLTSLPEEPLALPPGGTHLHFPAEWAPEQVAEAVKMIRGDDLS